MTEPAGYLGVGTRRRQGEVTLPALQGYYLTRLALDRGGSKVESCTYNVDGFCRYWTYKVAPGYLADMYANAGVADFWRSAPESAGGMAMRATEVYCAGCTAHRRRDPPAPRSVPGQGVAA